MSRNVIDFLTVLDREILLADGAKGTFWQAQGLSAQAAIEQNILQPRNIVNLHREYLEAGARIIETNTFAANRLQLNQYGLAGQLREINYAGVELARQAIKESGRSDVFIAGAIGPLGALVKPYGNFTLTELGQIYQEQIEILYEAGADLLIIETHPSLLEALEAVRAARSLDSRPIIAQMKFAEDGRSQFGDELSRSLEALAAADADVVGVNCGLGPHHMFDLLANFLQHTDLRVSVQPNAGLPQLIGQRQVYLTDPEYLQEYAQRFVEAGAAIIGGCCGTTPQHIRAMANVVTGQRPRRRKLHHINIVETTSRPSFQPPLQMPLEEKLGNQPIITAQIDAPPGLDYQTTLQQARRLLALGVDAIQVTDNPRARVRMSPIAFAHILQMETATEVVLHFTCRDRNLLGIQSELLGAAALGLRWVLALTGDPSSVGELPAATSVFDVNSTGLVRILHGLNQGATLSGTDIAYPTNFRIGASVNPAAPNLDLEIAKLQEKLDSHVSFIQTPPVFDLKLLEQFAQKVAPLNLPVLVSLMPLRDARHAEFLHHEVPGLRIPEWIRKRLNAAKPNDVLDESLQIAQELFLGMRQILRGVHLLAEDNFPAIERLLQTVTL